MNKRLTRLHKVKIDEDPDPHRPQMKEISASLAITGRFNQDRSISAPKAASLPTKETYQH